jgi:pimeloyl-ACP methyl ester carboxylesterase
MRVPKPKLGPALTGSSPTQLLAPEGGKPMPTRKVVSFPKISTNGRVKKTLLRAQFQLFSRFAPSLADRRAAALFLTPRRKRHPPAPSTPGRVPERFHIASGSVQLAAWAWGEGPLVLLAHGWNGHAAQLSGFIAPLVQSGFRVVAFDQPAHGHSTGKRTTVLEMAEAQQSIARAVGPLHAVVAHSLGATATALALFDHLPAARAVLIAPPANAPPFARELAKALGLSAERTEGMVAQVQRDIGVHLESLDLRRVAAWLRQPALIFHDVADREVPFAHGRAIANAWPGARFTPLEGLGHKRPLADAAVLRGTVAFLRAPRVVHAPAGAATLG